MSQKQLRYVALLLCIVSLVGLFTSVASAAYSTIPFGEESDAVRKMQNALRVKGFYKGAVDGKFGAATKKAVIKFQKSVGITADGKPGNKTLTALYEGKSAINQAKNSTLLQRTSSTNSHSLSYGNTGSRVRSLQKALRKAGCYNGSIDGVYGDLTYAAVRKYQQKKGLHVDGIAGKATIASLTKNTNITIGTSFVLDVGSVGSEVKKVAEYMTKLGYYAGAVSTTYTSELKKAVKNWQSDKGKTVTGAITEAQYNRIILGAE